MLPKLSDSAVYKTLLILCQSRSWRCTSQASAKGAQASYLARDGNLSTPRVYSNDLLDAQHLERPGHGWRTRWRLCVRSGRVRQRRRRLRPPSNSSSAWICPMARHAVRRGFSCLMRPQTRRLPTRMPHHMMTPKRAAHANRLRILRMELHLGQGRIARLALIVSTPRSISPDGVRRAAHASPGGALRRWTPNGGLLPGDYEQA